MKSREGCITLERRRNSKSCFSYRQRDCLIQKYCQSLMKGLELKKFSPTSGQNTKIVKKDHFFPESQK